MRELANKLKLDPAYLCRVEKGAVPPSERLLKKISKLLDVDLNDLKTSAGRLPQDIYEIFSQHPKEAALMLREKFEVYNYDREEHQHSQPSRFLEPVFETSLGKLYQCDCLDLLPTVDDESMDCIFADPPFNLNKNYGSKSNDNLAEERYINWSYQWLGECVRLLKPGGSLFVYNIPKWNIYYASFLAQRLTFRHWIAVNIKLCLPIPGRLYPSHYSLLYFTKGKPKTFNALRVPIPVCRHCGGDIKDYGGHRKYLNPAGLNITDVWDDIPPVRHKKFKTRSANELSTKLLDRVLKISTQEGDVVLDPFGGGGTTYFVAEQLKRKWIGCEIEDCSHIIRRFNQELVFA
jgi:site-specific DNA-methyltransferase (adenine-specific)